MGYLAVAKLSTYQHYKNRRPPWVKLYTTLLDVNHPLNQLPVTTRYLFDRMLLLAANYDNAIPNDSELLAKLLRMEPRDCREGIEQLLQGRWIVERQTKRRASKPASKPASKSFAPETETENREVLTTGARLLETQTTTPAGSNGLPFTQELLVNRILTHIGTHADNGTERVVRKLATHLTEAALAGALESSEKARPRDRAAYIVSTLQHHSQGAAA